jgi:release factor glutamine methyltransferase
MKYRKAFEWGKTRLEMAGVEESALDARLLLEYACKTTHNDLYVNSEMDLTEAQEREYGGYIMRRSSREPLQHIIGAVEFMGLDFFVSPDVLIPRQDTEILVEEAMIDTMDGDRVLDLCTGSGCILISLMRYKNDIRGVGSDISGAALDVARRNYALYADILSGTVDFVESDMFENIEGRFDVILSNPPYVRTADIAGLEEEVRDYDPLIALDGGEDGLDFYKRIADEAGRYLESEGRLILEIGFDQGEAVSGLLSERDFGEIRIIKDLAGLDRVVYARKE